MSSVVGLTELLTVNIDGSEVSLDNPFPVAPQNIIGKFREAFETFTPGVNWNLTTGEGDIVQLDGNAVSASYLVISKDPLSVGGVTTLETTASYPFPFEVAIGMSMSQRVLGQELSIELVSTETPLPTVNDIAITSISQTTTTLTVTTATPHDLVPGKRIGIYGVTSNSRLNYPSLVVATIPSATQFTCTAGPGGTIPSLTVGPYTSQGFIYFRPPLGYAQNGISEIFENASATNASGFARAAAGDSLPSGTINGNQSITVASTTGTQGVNTAYTYAWLPASEYRFICQADRVQLLDVGVDGTGQPSSRLFRTQVIPDPTKQYKLRFRFTNNKGLTVPTAKIVSASKSGSTTATITTATAHGLTTGDYVYTTGIRNGTDFPPITTAAVVTSTPTSTTFTVVMGSTTPTTTSYGGFVARGNGGNLPGGFAGAGSGAAVQTATVTATELILTSSGNFGVSIGDHVNVYGVRDASVGADLGVDGVYKVANVVTTTLTLVPISTTVLPAAFGSTSCGGAVIKRTDARISYVRIFDYLRERVEVQQNSVAAAGVPVVFNASSSLFQVAETLLRTNSIVNDISSAALTSTSTSGTITPGNSSLSHEYNVIVTAVSGTNPTLDVVVQESDDSGTNWYDVYQFPRITATGQYRSPLIPLTGNRLRYVRTVGGTSPSFTNSVNRQASQTSNPLQRQFIDRNMNPVTLNSTTSSFFGEGCVDWSIWMSSFGAFSAAPVLVFEGSPDNATWAQIGADITPAASTPLYVAASNAQARFIRIRVKTAGTGASIANITFKGVGN